MSFRPSIAALLLALLSLSPASSAQGLRVVTYNVWHGLGQMDGLGLRELESPARRENRFQWLASRLRATRPDVVLLQEVNPVAGYTQRLVAAVPGYTEIHQADNCGIKVAGVGVPSNFHQGLTILARQPLALESVGYRRLSGNGRCGDYSGRQTSETHIALAGRITWRGSSILVVNTHLHGGASSTPFMREDLDWIRVRNGIGGEDWHAISSYLDRSAARRTQEIAALADWVREQASGFDGIVVGGDFNVEPGDAALSALESLGLDDALENSGWQGATYDATRNAANIELEAADWSTMDLNELDLAPEMRRRIEALFELDFYRPKRLDYIFLSRSLGALMTRAGPYMMEPTARGYLASDHIGLLVELDAAGDVGALRLTRRH